MNAKQVEDSITREALPFWVCSNCGAGYGREIDAERCCHTTSAQDAMNRQQDDINAKIIQADYNLRCAIQHQHEGSVDLNRLAESLDHLISAVGKMNGVEIE